MATYGYPADVAIGIPRSNLSPMATYDYPADVAIGIPHPPPAVRTNTRQRCCSSFGPGLCCCIPCFAVLFLIGLIALPMVTHPSQPEISVVSASASSFNLTSFPTQLSADFDFTLSTTNPNKHCGLHYYSVDASLLYGADQTTIVEGSFSSFRHGPRKTTTVMGRLDAVEEHFLPHVGSQMADYLAAHKAVVFDLTLTARVSFHPGWFVGERTLAMQCKDITIWFATPDAGTTMEPPKKCDMLNVWQY